MKNMKTTKSEEPDFFAGIGSDIDGIIKPGSLVEGKGSADDLDFLKPKKKRNTPHPRTIRDNDPRDNLLAFNLNADDEQIGKIIADLREKKGLTKVALAAALGKTEGWVRSVELGNTSTSMQTLVEVANTLGHDVLISMQPHKK